MFLPIHTSTKSSFPTPSLLNNPKPQPSVTGSAIVPRQSLLPNSRSIKQTLNPITNQSIKAQCCGCLKGCVDECIHKNDLGPDLELKGKSNTAMTVPASKENESVPQDPQDKLLRCPNNLEDKTLDLGALLDDGKAKVSNGNEDMEIDITDCTKPSHCEVVEAECQDVTESESSFGDTVSGTENGLTMSDAEVESPFYVGEALTSGFDGYGGALQKRKKKLTAHWRRFIRPLMWRCKWIELQIKAFRSQALKYDRELAEYDRKKQFEFKNFALEGFHAKSLSFSRQIQRNKVMKRKKRKRVEETTDIASYKSCHNFFSYYENRRSIAQAASMDDVCGNLGSKTINGNDEFGFNNGYSTLEFRDGDNSLEQILWKIEVAQSQARRLKNRVDKVVSENPGKFSSINRLSLIAPCTSSDRNPASLNNGDRVPVRSLYTSSQNISECLGDLFMPESVVSSHGEVTPLPDMIESTDLPRAGGSSENEGILIHDFERLLSQVTERPPVPMEAEEADLPMKASVPYVEPNAESPSTSRSNFTNNKRKRGRRRSGTGRWKQ